jgi:exopolyphosphatase/pppGpp-phosphohydrolase
MVPDRTAMNSRDVDQVLIRMQRETAAELAADLGIPEARARVLPAGIAMVAAMIEMAQPQTISVGQSGLRVALLAEAFTAIAPIPDSNQMENVPS